MDKAKLHTPDLTQANIEKLAELFPQCVVEAHEDDPQMEADTKTNNPRKSASSADRKIRYKIDFDQLRQELSGHIVEGPQERYRLDWPGKREALLAANAPIAKTLRPARDESVDFDATQNLFIEGDNLDALKLLQETYLGKVKMIYIDPPYNTGNDFIYDDDFAEDAETYFERSNQRDENGKLVSNSESNGRFHSDWLNLMYSRLKFSRTLLSDDGSIFISIDDNEQANLKRLCDEIFGEQNFVSTIVWEKRYSPQNAVKWFSESHDFILVYAKNKLNWFPNLLERSAEMNSRYRNLDDDSRGVWKPADATAQAGHGTESQFYIFTAPNGKKHTLPNGRCWVYTESVMKKMVEDNRVWFGSEGKNAPAIKRFLTEVKQGTACQTIWKYNDVGHNQEGKKEINSLISESAVFETPKPTRLLKRILHLATDADSLVVDYFAGSSTTAHAVMQKNAEDGGNRRFIMVQLPEACDEKSEAFKAGYATIAEISKERIRRAGKKIKEENATTAPNLDTGFRVLKVDSSNVRDIYYAPDAINQDELTLHVDHIKENRSAEDLLFQVMLDWGVDLSLPVKREVIYPQISQMGKNEIEQNKHRRESASSVDKNDGHEVFFVDENAIAACFETGINEDFIKELAKRQPRRAVFRDSGFANDAVKINIGEVFKLLSPATELKTI